jgi:hypothetical protein
MSVCLYPVYSKELTNDPDLIAWLSSSSPHPDFSDWRDFVGAAAKGWIWLYLGRYTGTALKQARMTINAASAVARAHGQLLLQSSDKFSWSALPLSTPSGTLRWHPHSDYTEAGGKLLRLLEPAADGALTVRYIDPYAFATANRAQLERFLLWVYRQPSIREIQLYSYISCSGNEGPKVGIALGQERFRSVDVAHAWIVEHWLPAISWDSLPTSASGSELKVTVSLTNYPTPSNSTTGRDAVHDRMIAFHRPSGKDLVFSIGHGVQALGHSVHSEVGPNRFTTVARLPAESFETAFTHLARNPGGYVGPSGVAFVRLRP